jgi:ribosomal-protein-serine acetyltransferase
MTISLRAPTRADAPALVEMIHESLEDLRPWAEWAVDSYDAEDALKRVEDLDRWRMEGTAHEFFITDGDEGLLGICGLNRIDPANRVANLGYWVRTSAAGTGVAPRAARLLAGWAFANSTLHRLEIVIAVGNERSHRVAEKIGAHFEGVLRSRLWLHGQPHDARIYSMLRDTTPSDEARG